jgi:ABC-type branched-subunit amino acid transport system ATPase component
MSTAAPAHVLEVDGLHAGYGDSKILHGVSLHVDAAQLVAVIGPNGSGKSTLLKAIYGLINIGQGSVRYDAGDGGIEMVGMEPFEITAHGINYMPQRANVFQSMSVFENLEIGLFAALSGSTKSLDEDAAYERVLELFPMLRDRLKQQAGTLSGGQRQMVAMARALVSQPGLLLLDEPSAALAPNVVDEIFEKVLEIKSEGVSILLVEQNARRALAIADYGYVLEVGLNRYEGEGRDLLHDPNVVRLYLGGMMDPSTSAKGSEDA